MKNYDMVIVEMNTISIFDFMEEGESAEEAKKRGEDYYKEGLARNKGILSACHEKDLDYWSGRVAEYERKVETGCRVMKFEDFQKLQRGKLLSDPLKEITEEKFHEMLDVLPPLHWCTFGNVTEFCMSEMWTGSYTSQYAHVLGTNKYYTKMVDCRDASTWIHNLLKGVEA